MDMICRKTMARCQTPGMCSPHGGCQPDKGFEAEHLDLGKFVDWVWALKAERDQLQAEVDRLKHENRLLTEHNEFLASSDSRLAPELRAVKDALGLDFTASVSGEVVPLIERLRKLPTCWTEVLEQSEANDQLLDQVLELSADADRYRFLCDKFSVTDLPCALERILDGDLYVADGKPSIDSAIDAARAKAQ